MIKPFILFLLFLGMPVVQAAPETPLLIPGKTSLYQRVLSIPGATLATEAGASDGSEITPFSTFYVYQRDNQDGSDWLLVGTDRHGQTDGWVEVTNTLQWHQGLTVVFRDPTGHDRSLLFKDKAALKQLAGNPNSDDYKELYAQAVANNLPEDSPVSAIQPAGHIDVQKDFYLVPIRDHEDVYLGDEQARMLQIASVPLQLEPPPRPAQETEEATSPAEKDYTSGLVFVIDSSLSMDSYIDRTRAAVMKIYDQLGDSGLLGNVNFGLVAFRDNLEGSPEIEYVSRTFVTLEQGRDPGMFIDNVNNLAAASSSSQGFKEDAYAGIKQAIEQMDWAGHDAKYLILITDAGAREGDDPLSTTGLGTEEIRQLAIDNGIAIFVLHLLTEAQMADHETDARQYTNLSEFPGVGSLYYGVSTGDVNEFGLVLDSLAAQITEQVQLTVSPDTSEEPTPAAVPTPTPVDANPQLAALQAKVAKLGYTLRMQYLQQSGGQPPRVFDAWVLDRDLGDPQRSTLEVRVLLSRDQLSDLHDVLTRVLATAEDGLLSPQNFLNELKSLAATISRNPEELGSATATTAGQGNSLADLGFIGEYTEDLPYTSEVINLSLEDWQSWPAREQIKFLNRLEEKISYYQALHDHTDLWTSLDKGPVDGDAVFPVPLEMLP